MTSIRCACGWLPLARLCAGMVLVVLGASVPARAQAGKAPREQTGTVPREAMAVVVESRATSTTSGRRFGAGIIVG
jgi:hypothetical protein